MARIRLDVKSDYVKRLARINDPVSAVEELIWNSLDADATDVRVESKLNPLGGIDTLTITDNGHGMSHEECCSWFGSLGGSWKAAQLMSRGGRLLHGRHGHGRIRAFALGGDVRWSTVGAGLSGLARTLIDSSQASICEFEIGEPVTVEPATKCGTAFEARNCGPILSQLPGARAIHTLVARFALYLENYPGISIDYFGTRLTNAELREATTVYEIHVAGLTAPAHLRIIEWKEQMPRELYLCDASGVPQHTLRAGVQAPGFNFSAYLTWTGFAQHPVDLLLVETNVESTEAHLVDAAREQLRKHFRARAADRQERLVDEWKREGTYPYTGEATGLIEERERETFEAVAATVAEKLPGTKNARRLTLGLLRAALVADPEFLRPVLGELFSLGEAERHDLMRLLDRTRLSNLIRASTTITNRIDFIAALEKIVLEPTVARRVRERSELHQILENETWVFGEEYTLHVSDRSLTTVLERHLQILRGPTTTAGNEPVLRADGTVGRVDLMLSRAGFFADRRHHLIVELKRPGLTVGMDEFGQLNSYAYAVSNDNRFLDVDTSWDFWLIGTKIDEPLHSLAHQPNKPPGCAAEPGTNIRLWVRSWGELIDECQRRLRFYKKALDYESNDVHALDYLIQAHEDVVPEALIDHTTDLEIPLPRRAPASNPAAPQTET